MSALPGIQRDGTVFASNRYNDGQWVRFQRSLPRKIGGYKGVFLNAAGISRGMQMTSADGLNYVVSGYSAGLEQWVTDTDDGVGTGPYAYSLSDFTSSANNLWQFDIGYDSTGSGTNNLVAHPGQNLTQITSTVNTPVLYGEFPGASGSLSMSKVGVFTDLANTTNGSPVVTLTTTNVRVGAGQSVSGTGIPSGTTVSSVVGQTLTLSQNATVTTTAALSGVYLTSTAGDFTCTATSGLATGQLVNVSGTTSTSTLGGVYAVSSSGLFSYTGSYPLTIGARITVDGTVSNTSLGSVYATSAAGAFSCTASATTLSVGQAVVISGATSDSTLGSVYSLSTAGSFVCMAGSSALAVGQVVTVSGTSSATALSGVAVTGAAGTFTCSSAPAALQVGQQVVVSGTATATTLSNVYATNATGNFVCSAASAALQVGQLVSVSGTTGTTALSGVVITGTGGTFTCTTAPVTLNIGQPVVISGTFGGTGSITGYTDPKTYYIIATNGTTTFTLSATLGGAAVVTVAGTPTGVTYTLSALSIAGYANPTNYYITATNGSTTFSLSTSSGGAPVTSTVGAATGLNFNANATAITGYVNPTTYYIIATNSVTTFTLSATSGGAAITTTIGAVTGLSFDANNLAITGYVSPTNYYIIATNGSSTLTLSATSGGAAITNTIGAVTGMTFIAKATAITGYTTPTTYYIIATNGSTTFTLSTTPTGAGVVTTVGPTTGLTTTAQGAGITGYSNPTAYFVIATNGVSNFQLSATSGGAAVASTIGPTTDLTFSVNALSALRTVAITGTAGQFSCAAAPATLTVGQPVVIRGAFGGTGSITGYLNPTTYYIIATNGATTFTLSTSLGGSAITTTAGTPTGLTYTLSPAILTGYTNPVSYYIIATNGTTTFQLSQTLGGAALTTVIGATTNLTFTVSNPATLTFDNNIAVSGGCVVIHPYLFVYGNNGLIQNCSAGDYANWVSPDANANNMATGKIVKGLPIRGGSTSPSGLFWSTDSLVRVSFSPSSAGGQNYYWTYDIISSQTSIMSSQSVIEYDGIYYWAGVDRFLMYNGVVQEVENSVNQNWFFDNLNFVQRQKVWATKVPRYGEIWWFYPRGTATECTDAIIYNVREKTWYDAGQADGANRSAGVFSEVFPKPIWAGNVANTAGKYTLWQHEAGYDEVYLTNVNAINSYFETPNLGFLTGTVGMTQQPGENLWTRIERVEPDFVQEGDMTLVITGRGYAEDNDVESAPYRFTPSTIKIDMREQRREMRLRFSSNTQNGNYQTGSVMLSITTSDVRGTGNP
jgi:hypothetical protein